MADFSFYMRPSRLLAETLLVMDTLCREREK